MANKNKKEEVTGEVLTKDVITKKEVKDSKPYFFPRAVAYIIDILLVSIVCSGIMYLLPKSDNYSKHLDEFKQIQVEYVENKISYREYFNKTASVAYDVDYNNVLSIILEVIL